jgi:two-component system sensor histidine kinase KdpD
MRLLETFASQIGTAIERTLLAEEKRSTQLQFETEQLRNTLLSSVSHDLRTPLAVITGASSALVEDHGRLDQDQKHELASTVYEGVRRLNRLVRNLLDMTRVEAGALQVTKEWFDIEEVIGAALGRLEDRLADRKVTTRVPADLPLVRFDDVLVEQVLINLLENAVKYTPSDSPIEVSAEITGGELLVSVVDHGPGLPPDELERVFDKFHRVEREGATEGIGLGLTISRGVVVAHGGRLWAENRPEGGAAFHFTLPIEGAPPEIATPPEGELADAGIP